MPKPPKGYHNEDRFVSPVIAARKTPIHTQNEAEMSNIDEEDETMLESSQLDAPRSSKSKKKNQNEDCLLSLSVGGLDQTDSNFQMDDLADAASTLDISQSYSAKKRKTFVGNTPAKSKKGSAASKSNTPAQLKKRTSNTPGKIKKKSPLKIKIKKSKVGSKQTKRFNI